MKLSTYNTLLEHLEQVASETGVELDLRSSSVNDDTVVLNMSITKHATWANTPYLDESKFIKIFSYYGYGIIINQISPDDIEVIISTEVRHGIQQNVH